MNNVDHDPKVCSKDAYGNLTVATRCEKHPGYKAIRKPKVFCIACMQMYNAKHMKR